MGAGDTLVGAGDGVLTYLPLAPFGRRAAVSPKTLWPPSAAHADMGSQMSNDATLNGSAGTNVTSCPLTCPRRGQGLPVLLGRSPP